MLAAATIFSVVVLTLVCLAAPVAAASSMSAGHCQGPECQGAFHCADGAASVAPAPTPARAELPLVVLPSVVSVARPATGSLVWQSAPPAPQAHSFGPLPARAPPLF